MLTFEKREQFYDAEIAPALAALARKCEENGLSLFALVEWEPEISERVTVGRTLLRQQEASIAFDMQNMLAKSGLNLDGFYRAALREFSKRGLVPESFTGITITSTEAPSNA